MTDGFLITGVGLACPAGTLAGELLDAVRQKRVKVVSGHDLIAASTMEAAAARCPLDELGPIRLARYLSREAALFLYAGTTAARRAGIDPTGQPRRVGVVCATRTAGLSEYQQMYQSGRTGNDTAANLVRGPQSSFNAPASHLCLHLGIQGACLTLAGGPASGLTALRYAQSLLRAGRIDVALAGGVDGLSPCGSAPPRLPGEAAGVAALTVSRPDVSRPGFSGPQRPDGTADPTPLARLAPVVDGVAAAGSDLLPAIVERAVDAARCAAAEVDVVVASDADLADRLRSTPGHRRTVLVTEDATGLVGAAGGTLAAIAAAQYVIETGAAHVLCVSGDPAGELAAVVVSRVRAGGR